jgi:hypothetical protein
MAQIEFIDKKYKAKGKVMSIFDNPKSAIPELKDIMGDEYN